MKESQEGKKDKRPKGQEAKKTFWFVRKKLNNGVRVRGRDRLVSPEIIPT